MKNNEQEKIYELHTEFGNYKIAPHYTTYRNNDTLAIILINKETEEEYDDLTTNINDSFFCGENEQFVNCGKKNYIDFIKKNKLGKSTLMMGYSGFNKYECFKFDLSKMNKLEY